MKYKYVFIFSGVSGTLAVTSFLLVVTMVLSTCGRFQQEIVKFTAEAQKNANTLFYCQMVQMFRKTMIKTHTRNYRFKKLRFSLQAKDYSQDTHVEL